MPTINREQILEGIDGSRSSTPDLGSRTGGANIIMQKLDQFHETESNLSVVRDELGKDATERLLLDKIGNAIKRA